jgi:flagellar protein FlgJ
MSGIQKTAVAASSQQAANPEKEKKLRKACADFEALLTFNLLKTMRRTVPSGGLIPRSPARDTHEMMLDQHLADAIARKGQGTGIQKILFDRLAQRYLKNDSRSSGQATIR